MDRCSRRLYSRVLLGLKKKGRYYFITFISAPTSPHIEDSFKALKWWLKRNRPNSPFIYVLTSEGHGVCHMIMRIGKHEQPLDKKEVNQYWYNLTGATNHPEIRRVDTSQEVSLARYISDQRKLTGMGGEFAYQDKVIRWNWTKGWIPVGYCKVNGRAYSKMMGMGTPQEIRNQVLHSMVTKAFNRE